MMKIKLRCYVCGKHIELSEFALVSSTPNETDRVFVLHAGDCLAEVQEDQPSVVVKS